MVVEKGFHKHSVVVGRNWGSIHLEKSGSRSVVRGVVVGGGVDAGVVDAGGVDVNGVNAAIDEECGNRLAVVGRL